MLVEYFVKRYAEKAESKSARIETKYAEALASPIIGRQYS